MLLRLPLPFSANEMAVCEAFILLPNDSWDSFASAFNVFFQGQLGGRVRARVYFRRDLVLQG
jgi:hypothetical protein